MSKEIEEAYKWWKSLTVDMRQTIRWVNGDYMGVMSDEDIAKAFNRSKESSITRDEIEAGRNKSLLTPSADVQERAKEIWTRYVVNAPGPKDKPIIDSTMVIAAMVELAGASSVSGMQWVKACERLPQAGKPFFIRSVHTKSGGMMWGEEISKMEELENVEWLDDLPATPQPVTGEVFSYKELRDAGNKYAEEKWKDDKDFGKREIASKDFFEGGMWLFDFLQAASRPSDAVEFAEWIFYNGWKNSVRRDRLHKWFNRDYKHVENGLLKYYNTDELFKLFISQNT